jgi:hypothetical protein
MVGTISVANSSNSTSVKFDSILNNFDIGHIIASTFQTPTLESID